MIEILALRYRTPLSNTTLEHHVPQKRCHRQDVRRVFQTARRERNAQRTGCQKDRHDRNKIIIFDERIVLIHTYHDLKSHNGCKNQKEIKQCHA